MSQNPIRPQDPLAERKALGLLRSIVGESRGSFQLEGDRLKVTREDGARYFVDLRSAKVWDEHGKFVCLRVVGSGLPLSDEVIAKSLYLLTSPVQQIGIEHDSLFKVTFIGLEPKVDWSWINSMSLSSLGQTFSKWIGVDFALKRIRVDNLTIRLQIWYLNYSSQFRSLTTRYLQGSMGSAILCTGNANPQKLVDLQRNVDDLRLRSGGNLPMVFVGLSDEANEHTKNSAYLKDEEELAKRNNIPFFMCSLAHPAAANKPLACLASMILRRTTVQPATQNC